MNIWDVLILLAVAAMLFFAVRAVRGGRRGGCHGGCCGGCEGCGGNCEECDKKDD